MNQDSDVPCLPQTWTTKPATPSVESKLYVFFSDFWNKIGALFALIIVLFLIYYAYMSWQRPSAKSQKRTARFEETFFGADV